MPITTRFCYSIDMRRSTATDAQLRFGIGEWYGRLLTSLTSEERAIFGERALGRDKTPMPCLPRATEKETPLCTKAGGVCSLRLYQRSADGSAVVPPDSAFQSLRTTCPYRFSQHGLIIELVGEYLLGTSEPLIVKEVGFLESVGRSASDEGLGSEDVGRIDHILVATDSEPLRWCALEIQAVYFSGPGMSSEFLALSSGEAIPFPGRIRRPDYRSSGPKRLMPQLQIKVPALRRWGKKMAVLVDRDFFDSLGPMDQVNHISNSDIVWFVVKFVEKQGRAILQRDIEVATTLERAVEGLTAGRPVSLETFERRIRGKLSTSKQGNL